MCFTPNTKGERRGVLRVFGWQDSMALLLCLEFQLPDNCSSSSQCCVLPRSLDQLQLVSLTSAGVLTTSLCSSRLQETPATAGFLPSPASMLVRVLLPPASPGCSPLPTFRCCNVKISQLCLCLEQGIPCCVRVVQIVKTLREDTKGSLTPPFL